MKWIMHCQGAHLTRFCRGGFSLMEVALALVVVGIGMTTILAIFPVALDIGAKNNQMARISFLAEEIAQGLQADEWFSVDEKGKLHRVRPDWDYEDLVGEYGPIKLALPFTGLADYDAIWAKPDKLADDLGINTELEIDGEYHGLFYRASDGVDSHNIAYRVTISLPSPPHNSAGSVKELFRKVKIEVWGSVVGPTGKRPRPYRLYTEIHKHF